MLNPNLVKLTYTQIQSNICTSNHFLRQERGTSHNEMPNSSFENLDFFLVSDMAAIFTFVFAKISSNWTSLYGMPCTF